ncbi:MAG: DNA polymerase III subunit delta [Anaerolineae bacterium]|nr:DNA polymerase III subunit delta [Anaerolineae bacterium]
MFYIFQGEDTFSCGEALAELKAKMGDSVLADLNVTYLDGRSVDLGELEHHCDTIPFMSERRLVVVHGLLERLSRRDLSAQDATFLERLVEYLPALPETTRLVFVETSEVSKRHPVMALALRNEAGFVKTFALPQGHALAQWIRRRVDAVGGSISAGAVNALSVFVGNNLYQLDQEIAKLTAYAGGEWPIDEKDVQLLTPHAREGNIFEMVDALGRQDGRTASQIYHQLLDMGEHPLMLLTMIVRQFRLMIQIKELAPQLLTPEAIARELGQNPYPVKKILQQSRNFTMPQLRAIYHRLLEIDVEIKTGQTEATLALDVLIAELSRVG